MLKPLLLIPAVFVLGYYPVPIPASTPQESPSAPAAQAGKTPGKAGSEVSAHIKKIYEVDCALCHGAKGDGKTDLATDMKMTLDDWTDPKFLAARTDQQLFDSIRKGKGQMPPEDENRAKNDEVRGLIVYIRSMSKGQPTQAAPAPTSAPEPAAPAAPAAPATPATPPATAPSVN